MIQTKDIVAVIQAALNDNTDNIVFQIYADLGEYDSAKKVKVGNNPATLPIPGVLRTISGAFDTTEEADSYSATYTLELLGFESNYEATKDLIFNFAHANTGVSDVFAGDGYTSIFAYDLPQIGSIYNFNGANRAPMFLSFDITFVKSGILSDTITITLNGTPLPIIQASFSRNKIIDKKTYSDGVEREAQNQEQELVLDTTILYTSTLGVSTIRDSIFENNVMNTTYVINYNDGIIDKTYTMVITASNINLATGAYATLQASFAIAKV